MTVDVLIQRLDAGVPAPAYAHPGDAGADLHTTVDAEIPPGERALLPTGIAVALPDGYAAFVHPRSGLAVKYGVSLVNAPGTVDAGYRGEIKVSVVNLDPRDAVSFRRGDRIAQLVVQRVEARPLPRGRDSARLGACRGRVRFHRGYASRTPRRRGVTVFRRRKDRPEEPEGELQDGVESALDDEDDVDEPESEPVAPGRPQGPWDVDDVPDDDVVRLDLGSMRIPGAPGMEIQVNLDEAAGTVIAVTAMLGDSSLQLQAFAAPRREGIWDEVRRELAAEITRDGGIADVQDTPTGRSLKAQLPFPQASGSTALAAVRFIGCDGPRWFLRGVLTGPAAADEKLAAPLMGVFTGTVVVVRGNEAHAPREAFPLRLPGGTAPAVDADGRPMDREPLDISGTGQQITEIR